MTEMPKIGEVWMYRSNRPRRYVIKDVDDREVRLYDVKRDLSRSNYPLKFFQRSGLWERVSPPPEPPLEELCPHCEKRTVADDDYLCSECRWGV